MLKHNTGAGATGRPGTNPGMTRAGSRSQAPGKYVSLLQQCLAHDRSLPSPPAPQYGPTLTASLELLDIMDYQGKDKVVETLSVVGDELRERFEAVVRTKKHSSQRNWVSSAYRDRFLRLRGPLVATALVGLMKAPSSNALTTAALLLYAVARVYRSPDIVKSFGTDGGSKNFETRQLREAFATVRIPGIESDSLQTSPASRHALVWYNGQVFEVQILTGTYEPVPLHIIMQQLLEIQSQSSQQTSDAPTVATLSTYLTRAHWARERASLLKTHPGEMMSLETAITSIGIERQRPANPREAVAQRQGFGTVYSDQTLGYLVFPGGSYAYRGEHGALDGGALVRIVEEIGRAIESIPQGTRSAAFSVAVPASSVTVRTRPRKINFPPIKVRVDVSSTIPSFLQASENGIIRRGEDDLRTLKQRRLYGFVLQMAFQVALQQVSPRGSFTSVVEATATRDFADGRCDPNWLITHESNKFCSALMRGATDRDSLQAFEAAYKKYRSLLRQTRESLALAANIDLLYEAVRELKDQRAKNALLPMFPPLWSRDASLQGYSSDQLVSLGIYVFANDQVRAIYVGRRGEIVLNLVGSGRFAKSLPTLKKSLEQNYHRVVDIALRYARNQPQ